MSDQSWQEGQPQGDARRCAGAPRARVGRHAPVIGVLVVAGVLGAGIALDGLTSPKSPREPGSAQDDVVRVRGVDPQFASAHGPPTSLEVGERRLGSASTTLEERLPQAEANPLVESIVAKVNDDMRTGEATFVGGSLDPVGSESMREPPILTRRRGVWEEETSQGDGQVLAFFSSSSRTLERRELVAPRDSRAFPWRSDEGDAKDGGDSDGEFKTYLGTKTCDISDPDCQIAPPPPKTVKPNPEQCQIDKTIHPTHPNCRPDTVNDPLCILPTLDPLDCMPTVTEADCSPTVDAVCWAGPYPDGFGYRFGFHYELDLDPACLWIIGWPFIPVGAQQLIGTTERPDGGSYSWSVTQPGNQVTLTNVNNPVVTVTANAVSQTMNDILLRCTYIYTDAQGALRSLVDVMPMTVFKYDLQLHKPRVIDTAESAIPDGTESSVGAQTWVNLDNDDADLKVDLDDDNVATDDELIKVTLRVQPSDFRYGGLGVLTHDNEDIWKGWKDANKSLPYKLDEYWGGGDIFWMNHNNTEGYYLLAEGGQNWWAKDLWLEAIKHSDVQRDMELEIYYGGIIGVPVCDFNIPVLGGTWPPADRAKLTAITPHALAWEGMDNGFSPPSHESDILDLDPKHASIHLPNGFDVANRRVLPDARVPNTAVANDRVRLEVTLKPAPVDDVNLHVRGLDFDDPVANLTLDPNDGGAAGVYYPGSPQGYDAHDDNRGSVAGSKAGNFLGQGANGVAPIAFTGNDATATIELTLPRQPGDSVIAVVNGDADYLPGIENRDNLDGFGIVDSFRRGAPGDDRFVQQPADTRYVTDALTVYRLLHIERDSMAAITAASNRVTTTATNIPAGRIDVHVADVLDDGSLSMGPPDVGYGRFQAGTLRLGSGAGQIVVPGLVGSGTSFVRAPAAIALPFTIVKVGQGSVVGNVSSKAGTTFVLTLNAGSPALVAAHVGGTLTVAGHAMTVTGVTPATSTVTVGAAAIPVDLRDDDNEAELPQDPDMSFAESVFDDAYYRIEVDGGTALANNQHTVPVLIHMYEPDIDPAARQQTPVADETTVFWVGYVGSAFQIEPWEDADAHWLVVDDPRADGGTGGITGSTAATTSGTVVALGAQVSWTFSETCRDRLAATSPADAGLKARVTAHELGHQVGFQHLAGTLMNASLQFVQPNPRFSDGYVNLLRCRVNSPGQP